VRSPPSKEAELGRASPEDTTLLALSVVSSGLGLPSAQMAVLSLAFLSSMKVLSPPMKRRASAAAAGCLLEGQRLPDLHQGGRSSTLASLSTASLGIVSLLLGGVNDVAGSTGCRSECV